MSFDVSIGTILVFLWPMLISAAAWGVAIWALRESDSQSQLVERLTGSSKAQATKDQAVGPAHVKK